MDGATYYDFRTFFELVVLAKLNEAAAMGISFSSFWASQHTGHAFPPSNNRKWWLITLSLVRRLCAITSLSTPSERLGSIMTRFLNDERTKLDQSRVERLALLRELLRGSFARKPRWKRVAPRTGAVAGAGAGAGAGAAAEASSSSSSSSSTFASIFQTGSSSTAEFEEMASPLGSGGRARQGRAAVLRLRPR